MTEAITAMKANTAAIVHDDTVELPSGVDFLCKEPFDNTKGGIVVLPDGAGYRAIATPEAVMPGEQPLGGSEVLKRRYGVIAIASSGSSRAPKLPISASEMEVAFRQRGGGYARVVDEKGQYTGNLATAGLTPEMAAFFAETSTPPLQEWVDIRTVLYNTLGRVARLAALDGLVVTPIAVIGEGQPTLADRNPHRYVVDVTDRMDKRTGSVAAEVFKVLSVQYLGDIINTEAALRILRPLQRIAARLYAASVSAPFNNSSLDVAQFIPSPTEKQQNHMQRAHVAMGDTQGQYQSWREVLRRLGSPSAGPIHLPVPNTVGDYLELAHELLAKGEISTIGRVFGWHTDIRLRPDIGPDGVIEACFFDTFAGHADKIAAFQVFVAAIMRNLQFMVLDGKDPDVAISCLFGGGLELDKHMEQIHLDSLAVARSGMGARLHTGDQAVSSVDGLIELATCYNNHGVTEGVEQQIRRSYTNDAETRGILEAWCRRYNRRPSIECYYELGYGAPAIYMEALFRELVKTMSPEAAVRECELDLAQAFMKRHAPGSVK